jgi:hypothetical protein
VNYLFKVVFADAEKETFYFTASGERSIDAEGKVVYEIVSRNENEEYTITHLGVVNLVVS